MSVNDWFSLVLQAATLAAVFFAGYQRGRRVEAEHFAALIDLTLGGYSDDDHE
jgi:hypothetical protein